MNTLHTSNTFRKLNLTGFCLFALIIILAFASNPPNGKTGAPGDGACSESGCHTGSGGGLDGDITISGLPSSIIANTTYQITVTLDNPNAAANRAGFQWVALNSSNLNAGVLSNASSTAGQVSRVQTQAGRSYHEHSGSTVFPSSNVLSWTCDWTAPAGPTNDNITIYGVGNIANGSGSGGDRIVYTNVSGTLSAANTPPVVSIVTSTNVSCNGRSDGTATVSASSGTPNYTYLWDNGETTAKATALDAATHSVTVTDSAGQSASTSVLITQPEVLRASISSTSESSAGAKDGTASVSASGGTSPYSYLWNTAATNNQLNNLAPNTYIVTVTDNNGCTTIAQSEISAGSCALIVNANVQNESCYGSEDGMISLSITNAIGVPSIQWSTGADGNAILQNLSSGIYSATVTDDAMCSVILNDIVITQPDEFIINPIIIERPLCMDDNTGSLSYTATGGTPPYSALWSNGIQSDTLSNIVPGIYNVTVMDSRGCTQNTEISISHLDTINPLLNLKDFSLYLDEIGGLPIYNESDFDNGSSDNCGIAGFEFTQIEFDCDNLGVYVVDIQLFDINGNSATGSTQLTVLDTLRPIVTCPENVTINSCSQVNYEIPTATDNCSGIVVEQIEGLASGSDFPVGDNNIAYRYEDIYGNVTNCTFTISVINDLSSAVDLTNPSCFNYSNGSVNINISGGSPPYEIDYIGGYNTEFLNAGTYYYEIVDSGGCSIMDSFQITEPPLFVINDSALIHPSTSNSLDGQINIEISGGVEPFQFSWTLDGMEVSMDQDLSNAVPGIYIVTIIDANNCSYTSLPFELISTVSTQNLDNQSIRVEVFPNPSNQYIHVKVAAELPRIDKIEIFQMDGSLLQTVYVDKHETTMDLNNITDGLYILNIHNEAYTTSRMISILK